MPVRMSNRFVSHRVNLYEPDLLFSINCLSLNPEGNKLAVLRRSLPKDEKLQAKSTTDNIDSLMSHSLIELWNYSIDHRLSLGQVIHEDEDDPCLLESLGWSYDGRLWACGLNGRLHQVDFINSTLDSGYPLVSGAGWCLQFNGDKTLAAVGTERGYINVFNVSTAEQEKMGIDFVKTLDRDQARIMSLAWHEPADGDKKIISGSVGVIKIWNFSSGTCLNVIKASLENTIFWCLTIIDGFTIVSGDSKGNTSFWDGENATLINSIPSHKADVLCLTKALGKKHLLYSSGVDPSVITFSVDAFGKGIQSATLHLHSHDVRSLVFDKEWLISGGFDCYLTQVCAYPQKQIHQAPSFNNKIHVHKDRLMFQYSKSLEIWKIGSTNANNNVNNNNYPHEILAPGDASQLPLSEEPTKIVNIATKRLIHHSNFSGPWIAYSILEKIKVLHCSEDSINKVQLLCNPIFQVITGIEFVGEKFMLLSTGLELYIFKLDVSGLIQVTQKKFKHKIAKMVTSNDHVALSLMNRSIVIISTDDWSRVVRFSVNSIPTCLKFNPYQKDNLWLGFANHLITNYSISTQEFIKHSFNEASQYLPLTGLTFYANGFIAYDQDRLFHYNGSTWSSSDRYSHLAKVEYLPESKELLVIEVTSNMIKRKLPIRFRKKKFGT